MRFQGEGLKERKPREKPKTVKVSEEKQQLFMDLMTFLDDYVKEINGSYDILKLNKLFQVEINGKVFKIDLIEQRTKKN